MDATDPPNTALPVTPSIAIAFDTDFNTVALIEDGKVLNRIFGQPLGPFFPTPHFDRGSPVYVWVDCNPTTGLQVAISDQPDRANLSTLLFLVGRLPDLNGRVYFGFTAGTGGGVKTHDVLSWTITVSGPPGSVNGDGCADLNGVKASFNERSGMSGFNPLADVNGDGVVDIRDLALVAQKILAGTTCP